MWETQTYDAIWTVQIDGRQNGRTAGRQTTIAYLISSRDIYISSNDDHPLPNAQVNGATEPELKYSIEIERECVCANFACLATS